MCNYRPTLTPEHMNTATWDTPSHISHAPHTLIYIYVIYKAYKQ